jgi:hypothetical protein
MQERYAGVALSVSPKKSIVSIQSDIEHLREMKNLRRFEVRQMQLSKPASSPLEADRDRDSFNELFA